MGTNESRKFFTVSEWMSNPSQPGECMVSFRCRPVDNCGPGCRLCFLRWLSVYPLQCIFFSPKSQNVIWFMNFESWIMDHLIRFLVCVFHGFFFSRASEWTGMSVLNRVIRKKGRESTCLSGRSIFKPLLLWMYAKRKWTNVWPNRVPIHSWPFFVCNRFVPPPI